MRKVTNSVYKAVPQPTQIGSFLAFFTKQTNTRFLAGYWYTTLAFFVGIAVIALIDTLVPAHENPHEMRDVGDFSTDPGSNISNETKKTGIPFNGDGPAAAKKSLMRVGLFSALAIAIHNFPEGIAVSVPLSFATGNKKKAMGLSFLSGLTEPVGAVIGYTILAPILNDFIFA